ncbi:insulinoma-associated protein 2 [Numida meleagris]|uniref:insulinoma-associated protein 2 n=1 Tax=Numida meleagris TaxID=8996 RepID=UPI000B3E118F|nr:insulinoma-associated protein 2 [Numida meleagris]
MSSSGAAGCRAATAPGVIEHSERQRSSRSDAPRHLLCDLTKRSRGAVERRAPTAVPAAPPAPRRKTRQGGRLGLAAGDGCRHGRRWAPKGAPAVTPPGCRARGCRRAPYRVPRSATRERPRPGVHRRGRIARSAPAPTKLPPPPRTPLPAAPPPPVPALKRPSRAKAPAKKAKATRKLSFADEVTTSPVLGLRIKEEGPEGRPGAEPPGARTPLGEFICQLCKERYADPLALAQHRCSRIVRVEYRCPECHKIFSCPANLASHRRWHKPRPGPSAEGPAAAPAGKENSPERRPRAAPQPPPPPPPRQHLGGADSGAPAPGAEAFSCPCCQKRFRRQAYLRKHLGTHGAPRPAPLGPPERGQLSFGCHLCGARFPSADIRDKHRLWHAVRDELLLPPPPGRPEGGGAAGGERQGFPCKQCPATFFSAPGLARHASKCHPAEGRQVLLLQVPVRPGC